MPPRSTAPSFSTPHNQLKNITPTRTSPPATAAPSQADYADPEQVTAPARQGTPEPVSA
jgi:hypothetical protein